MHGMRLYILMQFYGALLCKITIVCLHFFYTFQESAVFTKYMQYYDCLMCLEFYVASLLGTHKFCECGGARSSSYTCIQCE